MSTFMQFYLLPWIKKRVRISHYSYSACATSAAAIPLTILSTKILKAFSSVSLVPHRGSDYFPGKNVQKRLFEAARINGDGL
jgi:hypothetical protein